jgi:hypothetical protein
MNLKKKDSLELHFVSCKLILMKSKPVVSQLLEVYALKRSTRRADKKNCVHQTSDS